MIRLLDPGSFPLCRLWWLAPGWLFAVVIGGTMALAAMQSEHAFWLYGTPKYIDLTHVLLTVGTIVAFVFGCRIAEATGRQPAQLLENSGMISTVRFWFYLTTFLALFGYAAWIGVAVHNGLRPATILELILIDDPELGEEMRSDYFLTIPGITTCTQFGVAAVPLGMWLFFHGERRAMWPVALLIVIASARALINSERLALIELVIPAGIIGLRGCILGQRVARLPRAALQATPALAVAALFVVFGGFEYFRSWRYYQQDFDSFVEFTAWRVGGYYTAAHNNGAMALVTRQPRPLPYATLRPLWDFPGLSQTPLAYEKLTRVDPAASGMQMLEAYGTPELNNEGGLFQPALDLGLGGSLLFWFGYGFVAARLYRGFLIGTFAGLMLYPLFFLSILEVPRLLYLLYGRSFPGLVALFVVIWLVRQAASTVPLPAPQPAA